MPAKPSEEQTSKRRYRCPPLNTNLNRTVLVKRFHSRWRHDPSGCHIWTGARHQLGYGLIWIDNKRIRAHRLALELATGQPVDPTLVVRHRCDNPPCVNPEHLEVGTQADNNWDKVHRGRHAGALKTHCKHGHELFGDNLYMNPGGFRQCRTCVREAGRAYKEKRRRARLR